MYDFMEYCLRRYYRASGWNEDNQYSHLCATSRALLDFQAPQGLSLRLSKLPSSVFKTTTTMNALPLLEGSLGYLFTSRPLQIDDSASVRFRHLMSAQFQYDKGKYCAEVSFTTDDGLIGVRGLYNFGKDFDDSYEAMLKEGRARSGALQDETVLLDNPDSAFIDLEQAHGKEETVASSDKMEEILRLSESTSERKGYLGDETPEDLSASPERIRGYWSAGAEIYYSATEKLGGVSTGLRYRTLPPLVPSDPSDPSSSSSSTPTPYPTSTAPEHHQNYIPVTITQTLNPIMGHVSSSYAAQVHPDLGLCSRFDFNLYSYDSDLTAGVEWWIRERKAGAHDKDKDKEVHPHHHDPFPETIGPDFKIQAKKEEPALSEEQQPIVGVIKARLGVQSGLALMWEGRFNKLLFSLGFVGHVFSPGAQAPIVKSVGLEIQYFS
ncbi:Mitochondrial distribution and morphology protein 10 [Podila minutissima]|uniref:Mitochondrial distribution and morphology protein 10 n=1 Tax=Podila minutissima TaxID=64525 RepID=A0A9P5SIN8_9FUNG|nr:Mitochondrial distribution and morphology protein 10 [Podila minutissima]